MLLLAIHVAAASAPCPSAKLPDHETAHPCPAHSQTEAGSTWFDPLCPCGCESGAPPGVSASRIPPALLLAQLSPLSAPERAEAIPCVPRPAAIALAPPDHVPLAVA